MSERSKKKSNEHSNSAVSQREDDDYEAEKIKSTDANASKQ